MWKKPDKKRVHMKLFNKFQKMQTRVEVRGSLEVWGILKEWKGSLMWRLLELINMFAILIVLTVSQQINISKFIKLHNVNICRFLHINYTSMKLFLLLNEEKLQQKYIKQTCRTYSTTKKSFSLFILLRKDLKKDLQNSVSL